MSDAADVLTGADTLTGTATIDGEEIDYVMENPTKSELDDLDDDLPDDADNFEAAYLFIDRFLAEPDVDVDDIPAGYALGMHHQMQVRIAESSGVKEALEEMPLDGEGNE